MRSEEETYQVQSDCFIICSLGFELESVLTLSHASAAGPAPSSTHALFIYLPAWRSPWFTLFPYTTLFRSPGARFVTGVVGVHTRLAAFGSVTSTLWSVMLPVLVASIV